MANPWNGSYVASSGNLFGNFQANLNAEVNGRVQVCRLYETTDDPSIRDAFQYKVARDTMYQNRRMTVLQAAWPGDDAAAPRCPAVRHAAGFECPPAVSAASSSRPWPRSPKKQRLQLAFLRCRARGPDPLRPFLSLSPT